MAIRPGAARGGVKNGQKCAKPFIFGRFSGPFALTPGFQQL